jgi:hypothetical protein
MSSRAYFPISIGRLAKGARPRTRRLAGGQGQSECALIAAEIAALAEGVAVGVQA